MISVCYFSWWPKLAKEMAKAKIIVRAMVAYSMDKLTARQSQAEAVLSVVPLLYQDLRTALKERRRKRSRGQVQRLALMNDGEDAVGAVERSRAVSRVQSRQSKRSSSRASSRGRARSVSEDADNVSLSGSVAGSVAGSVRGSVMKTFAEEMKEKEEAEQRLREDEEERGRLRMEAMRASIKVS